MRKRDNYSKNEFLLLQKIQHYETDGDLLDEIKEPSYAAVTGRVVADGNVITSKYDSTVKGVIHSLRVKEHRAEWQTPTKRW